MEIDKKVHVRKTSSTIIARAIFKDNIGIIKIRKRDSRSARRKQTDNLGVLL